MKQVFIVLFIFLTPFTPSLFGQNISIQVQDFPEIIRWDSGNEYQPHQKRHMYRVPFTVLNDGSQSRSFFITVAQRNTTYDDRVAIGTQYQEPLSYAIYSSSVPDPGAILKEKRLAFSQNHVIQFTDIRPGQRVRPELYFSISPKQYVHHDLYTDTFDLEIISGTLDNPGPVILSRPITFIVPVKRTVSIQFPNNSSEFYLGDIESGMQKTFDFQLFSNDTYFLDVTTKNDYTLHHIQNPNIRIAYTLAISPKDSTESASIAPKKPISGQSFERTPNTGKFFTLSVTIDDSQPSFTQGTYKDVVYLTLHNQ